jgi:electron transport complex protein RnfG
MKESRTLAPALAVFGALGLVAALLLAGLNALTGERIAHERRDHALRAVSAMLPEGRYDNDLLDTAERIEIPGLDEATAYTARLSGKATALVVDVVTPNGYSGDIRLLVAVSADGAVLGSRILEHRETPGLGDRIEHDKSDWLTQFDGRSLGRPPAEEWAPDRRGGAFDTVTSATISSAAVVDAIKRILLTFESRGDALRRETQANGPSDGND